MPYLRQSTSQVILFGPCLDKTDGVSEEISLTLAQADMRLSKDGGAFAQKNVAGNATHDSDGWYSTTLDATDTATVGELIINIHQPANMLPVWKKYWVLEESIYDAMFGASAAGFDASGRVDIGLWLGTAVTLSAGTPDVNIQSTDDIDLSATQKASVNTEADTALTDYDGPTNAQMIARTILATSYFDPTADTVTLSTAGILAIWHQANSAIVTAGSMGKLLKDEITSARMAVLTDWIDAGRLDLLLDAIPTTAMRGTDSAATATALATAQADLDVLTGSDGATLATAQALYAPSKAGDAMTLTTAGILAIWHQLNSAIITAGSMGKLLKDEITSARMAVLTDWIDAGRLDLLLDAIPTTAMRGTDSAATATALATAQADLDVLTGSDGATLATAQALYAPSKAGDAMALTTSERDSNAAALLDLSNAVETGITVRQLLRLAGATLAGVLSGAATTTVTIKAADNSGTTRIVATVDSDGNRSALTLTP